MDGGRVVGISGLGGGGGWWVYCNWSILTVVFGGLLWAGAWRVVDNFCGFCVGWLGCCLYLCAMKKILRIYHYWRCRRLLRKLFWFYAKRTDSVLEAIRQANNAFIWFTGEEANDDSNWINYWWFL